ncbi:hypothetical protein [Caedibacter taeniospiralis]|jgi:hypothetical protein|uniref:hypothetical protein n=1 Tax=Caedibacter taeniospiralis TaxID=28907 RepID=UPI0037BFDB9A
MITESQKHGDLITNISAIATGLNCLFPYAQIKTASMLKVQEQAYKEINHE